jgi:hypothetical protein
MFAQEEEEGIRTNDLRFIRRGPSRLRYLLKTIIFVFICWGVVVPFQAFRKYRGNNNNNNNNNNNKE